MAITYPIDQWLADHWSRRDQNLHRDHVLRVLADSGFSEGVEVGTFRAEFAERILQRTAVKKLYCIDPYQSYNEYQDLINFFDLQSVFEEAQRRLAPYGDRYKFVRTTSDKCVNYWIDGSLDFAYIDGNHSYNYVLADLEMWWPKIKHGGMIIGDDAFDKLDDPNRDTNGDISIVWDYSRPNDLCMYGVTKAFVDFAQAKSVPVIFHDTQAFLIKTQH